MYVYEEVIREDGEIFDLWLKHENVKKWIRIDDWFQYFDFVKSQPNYYLIKFIFENKIIGVIGLEIVKETGNITIIVDPEEQNKGHGKRILSLFLKKIKKIIKKKIKNVYSGVYTDNIASKRCCESCGFKLTGIDEDGFMEYIYDL